MRLAESAGSLELLDARQHPELVRQLGHLGYSLDEGMLVVVGERYYHGAAAIHVLALMSSRSGWFNRLNYTLFRSPKWSSAVYPILVFGRRVLLRVLGRKPIGTT
jgi:hypothetical protein